MLRLLRERVVKKPDDSESWRLIGRLERKRNNLSAAVDAAGQAVALDELNAAAHFDFAELLQLAELPELAREHFEKVLAIAPDSSYATQVLESGFQLDIDAVSRISTEISRDWSNEYQVSQADGSQILQDGKIQQAGYEIQTFDGDDEVQQRLRQQEHEINSPNPLRLSLESGALYNTNISLTPISRELAQSSAASAQFFAAPDAEWTIKRLEDSRYGLQGKGFFTVNEDQWSAFNLASFQPGAFFEKIDCFCFTEQVLAPGERVQMPVSFYVDPEIVKDRDGKFVHTITLSYTFYQIDLPEGYAALEQATTTDLN